MRFRTLVAVFLAVLLHLHSLAPGADEGATDIFGPPEIGIAAISAGGDVEIRRFDKRRFERTVKEKGPTYAATGERLSTTRIERSEVKGWFVATRVSIAELKANRVDGRAVSAGQLNEALARPTPVLLSDRGASVDARFQKLVRPDTLVLSYADYKPDIESHLQNSPVFSSPARPGAKVMEGPPDQCIAVAGRGRTLDVSRSIVRMVTVTTEQAGQSRIEVRPLEETYTQRIELDRIGCRTVAGQLVTTAATLQALRTAGPVLFTDSDQRLDPHIAAVFRPETLILYYRTKRASITPVLVPD